MNLTQEFLNNCSRVIINIFTTTQLDEQDKIIEIAKIMSESAKISGEYSKDMIKVYETTYKLLKKLTKNDFEKVLKISQEN